MKKNVEENITLFDKILRKFGGSGYKLIVAIAVIVFLIISGISQTKDLSFTDIKQEFSTGLSEEIVAEKGNEEDFELPEYSGTPYVHLADKPNFSEDELYSTPFEYYSDLDELGRCQFTKAVIGKETMPTGERGAIGSVKPTGWHTVKYDCVDGKYLYNRCHLIGWQLTGENANEKNLITGTRYMNVDGMLPFENMVADYIKETGNHVAYSVTPIYKDNELVARGVQMDAYSIEDAGNGICFSVYCFNVQPGVEIDYLTGESKLEKVS